MAAKPRTFEELVAAGRELAQEERRAGYQWRWADLALEVEPIGKQGKHSGSYDRLREWAVATDCPYSINTLCAYRRTAAAWPPEERTHDVGFGIYAEFANHKHLKKHMKPGLTAAAAQKIICPERETHRTRKYRVSLNRLAVELQRPGVVEMLLSDFPEVRAALEAALGHKPSRGSLMRLLRAA